MADKHVRYMAHLRLDDNEVESRRAYFEIRDDDLKRLAALRPFAERCTDAVVEELYELILAHPATRAFFGDEATLRRVKRSQRDYFLGLFSGRCDLAYVQDRLRIGLAHERVAVPPKWYLGAYSRHFRSSMRRLFAELPPVEAESACHSLTKLMMFDMALAMDTYIAAHVETITTHQQAIRQLSTPVIKIHDRVLLLPLVGTIDTWRAEQIMESVLLRVSEDEARIVLMDIAGVPVVDTAVANHLLKTMEAVALLGAKTILSGMSAAVAKSLVGLGVDLSSMETRGKLAEALELALEMMKRPIEQPGRERRR